MKINLLLKGVAILAVFAYLGFPLNSGDAEGKDGLPVFRDFVTAVEDGNPGEIRGVYVPGTFAFPVLQQPSNDPGKVMETEGVVTQFRLAAQYDVIGLLAHNNLAGAFFPDLTIGQEIRIVYGDGQVQYFMVNHMNRFKVVQIGGAAVGYMDLITYKVYTTTELFTSFYEGTPHVTFQTCIQMDDEPSWGRLFITAIPVPAGYFRGMRSLNLTGLLDNPSMISALEFINGTAILK